MAVKVLSLFDGMACGMLAMMAAGVEVESYDAYEIDKYAVKTATHNFPMIEQHGDVFKEDFTRYDGVDFLVGGSPCTYWSIAQTKNRETVASGMGWELFSQYVRALREAKPKYFIYENNKSMSKEIRASIDEAFGFEAVCINSALVSAQNRQRLYWVGRRNADGTYSKVNVEQPEDRGILLKDVLDGAMREKAHAVIASAGRTTEREFFLKNQGNMAVEPINTDANGKAFCVTSQYYKGFGNNPGKCLEKHRDSMAAEPVAGRVVGRRINEQGRRDDYNEDIPIRQRFEANDNQQKTNCLTTVEKDNRIAEPVCVAERGRMYRNEPQHYEARPDEKTNTLTSVEKDNRVAEPVCYAEPRGAARRGEHERNQCWEIRADDKSNAVITGHQSRLVSEPVQIGRMPREDGIVTDSKQYRVYDVDGKAVTQCGQGGGLGAKTGLYAVRVGTMPNNAGDVKENQSHRIYSVDAKGRTLMANSRGGGNTDISAPATGLYAVPVYECPKDCEIVITDNSIRCMRHDAKRSTVQGSHVNFEDGKSQTLSPSHVTRVLCYAVPCEWDENGEPTKAVSCSDGKVYPVYKVENGEITIKDKQYPIKLVDGYYIIRKLTVSECMRLQTVPEWYDFSCVSNSQAYKMLGNGWTVEVIAHLIRSALCGEWVRASVMAKIALEDPELPEEAGERACDTE